MTASTMSLTNGCICCSIGAGFIETIVHLARCACRFDHIVIEASGVGDPWRIAEIALVEPGLRLNGVIVLADCSRIESTRRCTRRRHRAQSVRECDVVLLSKTDLVAADALEIARRTVRPGFQSRIERSLQHSMPDLWLRWASATQLFRFMPTCHGRSAIMEQGSDAGPIGVIVRSIAERLADAIRRFPPQLLRLKGTCRVSRRRRPQISAAGRQHLVAGPARCRTRKRTIDRRCRNWNQDCRPTKSSKPSSTARWRDALGSS